MMIKQIKEQPGILPPAATAPARDVAVPPAPANNATRISADLEVYRLRVKNTLKYEIDAGNFSNLSKEKFQERLEKCLTTNTIAPTWGETYSEYNTLCKQIKTHQEYKAFIKQEVDFHMQWFKQPEAQELLAEAQQPMSSFRISGGVDTIISEMRSRMFDLPPNSDPRRSRDFLNFIKELTEIKNFTFAQLGIDKNFPEDSIFNRHLKNAEVRKYLDDDTRESKISELHNVYGAYSYTNTDMSLYMKHVRKALAENDLPRLTRLLEYGNPLIRKDLSLGLAPVTDPLSISIASARMHIARIGTTDNPKYQLPEPKSNDDNFSTSKYLQSCIKRLDEEFEGTSDDDGYYKFILGYDNDLKNVFAQDNKNDPTDSAISARRGYVHNCMKEIFQKLSGTDLPPFIKFSMVETDNRFEDNPSFAGYYDEELGEIVLKDTHIAKAFMLYAHEVGHALSPLAETRYDKNMDGFTASLGYTLDVFDDHSMLALEEACSYLMQMAMVKHLDGKYKPYAEQYLEVMRKQSCAMHFLNKDKNAHFLGTVIACAAEDVYGPEKGFNIVSRCKSVDDLPQEIRDKIEEYRNYYNQILEQLDDLST